MSPARYPGSVMDLFWAKVNKGAANGCWEWTGHKTSKGYGMFGTRRKPGETPQAHRIAYQALVGSIPEGMQLDHLCRNRACVNPAHLEPVTNAENVRRGLTGIVNRSKTHCKHGHLFDEANTYRRPTIPGRYCLTCIRASDKKRQRVAA